MSKRRRRTSLQSLLRLPSYRFREEAPRKKREGEQMKNWKRDGERKEGEEWGWENMLEGLKGG